MFQVSAGAGENSANSLIVPDTSYNREKKRSSYLQVAVAIVQIQ